MEIAFIGHGYHKRTKSSAFFIDILKENNNVTIYFDYTFNSGIGVDIAGILKADYDLIVVFQVETVAQKIAEWLPERLIFVPMFDSACFLPPEFWARLRNSRILNFSWALHVHLQRLEVPSLRVQYFPDPDLFEPVTDFSKLTGFLWQRRQEIAWPTISCLCAGQDFARFNLHLALDPDYGEPHVPDTSDISKFNISISHWSEDRKNTDNILAQANVYFAPRPSEGIGMSFLEAMARGQCVVAPDAPTMSEYMTHRVSGLLYDTRNPCAFEFSSAEKIGVNARRAVERGFMRWRRDRSDLLPTFLFGKYSAAFRMGERASRRLVPVSDPAGAIAPVDPSPIDRKGGHHVTSLREQDLPLVTIAIVVRNGRACFLRTLSSVLAQTYRAKEVIMIDGNSSDGTLDLIRSNSDILHYCKSEPDKGPYDGMNKAADVANGRYILFMSAGDEFANPNALAEAMEEDVMSIDPDFIIGHHIHVTQSGIEELCKAIEFDDTWMALTKELISKNWLRNVPCHRATLTRTALLRGQRYDISYRIAADLEFLCRQRAAGARVHNCDVILTIHFAGGLSSRNEALCHREWTEIVRLYGGQKNADQLSWQLQTPQKPRWFTPEWRRGLLTALHRRLRRQ